MCDGGAQTDVRDRQDEKQFEINNCGHVLPSGEDPTRIGDDSGNGDAKGVNCFNSPIASSARSRISSAFPSTDCSKSAPVRDSGTVLGTWIP